MNIDRRQFLAAAGSLAAISLFPEHLPAAPVLAEPLNVGLIGMGKQGRAIALELAKIENIKLVAIAETDEMRRASAASRNPAAKVYATHNELIEKHPEISAIIIATPTHEHKVPALASLSAGKHVFCEAPLAHSIEDAKIIAKAASEAAMKKIVFAVGFQGRANPVYNLARSFYKTDAFKDFACARTHFAQKTSWRVAADGEREKRLNWRLDKAISTGLMGEVIAHQLDVINWYRGAIPTSLRAIGSIRLHTDGREVHDTVHATFTYDDGGLLTSAATLANSYEGQYELLQGSSSAIKLAWSHGWMFKESDSPTQGWEVYANRQQFHTDTGITLIADATQLASQGKLKDGVGLPNPSLYYSIENFIKATSGSAKVACNAEDAMKTTILALMANRSIETGHDIKLDPALFKL